MSTTKHLFLFLCITQILTGCKKHAYNNIINTSSIVVVNSIAHNPIIKLYTDNQQGSSIIESDYYNGFFFTAPNISIAANSIFNLKFSLDSDSTQRFIKEGFSPSPGKIYTVYFSGNLDNVKSTILEEVNLPHPTDSVMAIRFVNLNSDLVPINIKVISPNGFSEVPQISYMGITSFNTYDTKSEDDTYKFEIYNSNNDQLLTTYDFEPINNRVPKFSTLSLIIKGNNTVGYQVVRVDY